MCFWALYDERTKALLSTCLNPKSNPIFSYSLKHKMQTAKPLPMEDLDIVDKDPEIAKIIALEK